MAEHVSYAYTLEESLPRVEAGIEPPRTRIAVACNRCRRRKIKCSGSLDNGSCEGCIRANGAECIFADRPQSTKSTGLVSPTSNSSHVPLQPPGPPRSSSLPSGQPILSQGAFDRPYRSMSSASHGSGKNNGSPPIRHSTRSPSFPMSPSHGPNSKRPSVSHPYQRPGSSGEHRRSSGDQVSNNLLRYSQSLVQSQAQQLSNRVPPPQQQQQKQQRLSVSMPTSVPQHYASAYASLQPQQVAYQMAPALPQMPSFRQPDYNGVLSSSMPDFSNAPPDFVTTSYGMNISDTPGSACDSPVFQPSLYSVSTPELISSDSVSTLDMRTSSSSLGGLDPMQDQCMTQPYMNMDYTHLTSGPVLDPSKWTPGLDADKFANQWLQFSPQQHDSFHFNG